MPDRPLDGKIVLVTRPEGRGRGLARWLEARGATVALRPTIDFALPADPRPVLSAMERFDTYEWVVATSPTGVKHLLKAMRAAGRSFAPGRPRLAAVGPATASRFERAGVPVDLVAERSDAEGLAESLRGRVRPGEHVLLVRPEEARPVLGEALVAMGADLDSVVFYRTVPAAGCAGVARDAGQGAYDAVVFTSPSTLRCLLEGAGAEREALLDVLRCKKNVAIGSVTARAMTEAGLPPATVAFAPTDGEIADAVERAFAS